MTYLLTGCSFLPLLAQRTQRKSGREGISSLKAFISALAALCACIFVKKYRDIEK